MLLNGNNASLKDAINGFIDKWSSDQHLYYKVGTASEINTSEYTFTFTPLDESANVVDVKMKTIASSEKTDFMIVVPKEGSKVIVMFETPVTAYCVLVKDSEEWRVTTENGFFDILTKWEINCDDVRVATESWVFNDGNLEGLINIVELTEKLNDLADKVNDHIQKFNTHVHPGVTVGAVSTLPTLTTETPTQPFDKNDYEDTKIKH